ncbi:unnamed protein product [Orchesella dallaii]|uniref:CCHC-type domain-containing protein n=1 Tax=Orchesella dallaii TaxID=48710 RepID=A0ABP1RQF3_9HEXA
MPKYWHNGNTNFFRDFFIHKLVLVFSYIDVLASTLDTPVDFSLYAVEFLFIVVTPAAAFLREVLALVSSAANQPEDEEPETANLAVFPACRVTYPDMLPIRFVQAQEIMQNMTVGLILSSFGSDHPNGCGIEFPCVQCMTRDRHSLPSDIPSINVRDAIMGPNYRAHLPCVIYKTQPLSSTELFNLNGAFPTISNRVADTTVPESSSPLIPVTPPPILCTICQDEPSTSANQPIVHEQGPQENSDQPNARDDNPPVTEVDKANAHPHSPERFPRGPFPPPNPSQRGGRQTHRPRNQNQNRRSINPNQTRQPSTFSHGGTHQHLQPMCMQQYSHLVCLHCLCQSHPADGRTRRPSSNCFECGAPRHYARQCPNSTGNRARRNQHILRRLNALSFLKTTFTCNAKI